MDGSKDRTRTRVREGRIEIAIFKGGRERDIRSWSEGTHEMTCVCSKEGECRGSGASKTADVADCVAGDVKEVEGAVVEVVVGAELADSEVVVEFELLEVATSVGLC